MLAIYAILFRDNFACRNSRPAFFAPYRGSFAPQHIFMLKLAAAENGPFNIDDFPVYRL
jgi:hypothetical protein